MPEPSHYLGSAPTVEKFDWGNDPTCVPAPEHPNPVVLVPGTWAGAHDMAPWGATYTTAVTASTPSPTA